jgi:hypothetical protein
VTLWTRGGIHGRKKDGGDGQQRWQPTTMEELWCTRFALKTQRKKASHDLLSKASSVLSGVLSVHRDLKTVSA